MVGAFLADANGRDSGSAYVFEEPVGGWTTATETAKLTRDADHELIAVTRNPALVLILCRLALSRVDVGRTELQGLRVTVERRRR